MSILGSIGNAAKGAIGNTIIPGLGHAAAYIDPTPGFSATNVAKTQAGNAISTLLGGNKVVQSPTARSSAQTPATDPTSGPYVGAATSTAAGGAGTLSVDPQAAAYYDNLAGNANSQIDRLGNQENIGLQNIGQAYNDSLNKLNTSKDITTRDYNTQKDQTLQDNVQAKGNIDYGVYQHNNSLQKLLGAHGYTGSANQAASYAAAREGSQQRNQVQSAFGRNQQALDTNFGDWTNGWQNSVGDLGTQKQQQENQLHQSIAQNKATLLSQLAGIAQQKAAAQGLGTDAAIAAGRPYEDQVNSLGAQIDQLGLNPSFSANAPVYKAPTLEAYNYDRAAAPTISGQPGFADTVNPYLSVLLGQQKKQQLNPLSA